jgi:dephospho-CoA kinase
MVMVWAPEALRLQRVTARDRVPAEAVQARMAQQMPDDEKRARADHVIVNDGEHALVPQVWELDRLFRQLAAERLAGA